jgi:hypothetical protein
MTVIQASHPISNQHALQILPEKLNQREPISVTVFSKDLDLQISEDGFIFLSQTKVTFESFKMCSVVAQHR